MTDIKNEEAGEKKSFKRKGFFPNITKSRCRRTPKKSELSLRPVSYTHLFAEPLLYKTELLRQYAS